MNFLDINDWQLTSRSDRNLKLVIDTAAASTANGELCFGEQALKHARSHPQRFNNKYLYSLAADPIAGDLSPAKNYADLIYHHLRHVGKQSNGSYVLGISGHLTNQQLGLLLGICKEADLEVLGFVDLGLAIGLSVPASTDFHVLDVELHRMTLSHIQVNGKHRSVQQTTAIDGIGAGNITEGWMNLAADEFVQKTRYDPLHAGDSEQQLFEQVWGWLGSAQLSDHRVTVNTTEASRDIEIRQPLLVEKLAQRLDSFDFTQVHHLVCGPRISAIPGLDELLKTRVSRISSVVNEDIARNYRALAEQLDKNQIRRVTSANAIAPEDVTGDAIIDAQENAPSHLLHEHTAHAITDRNFAAHIDPHTCTTLHTDISVNGLVASGAKVALGDTVCVDGVDYVAIRIG